MVKVGTRMDKAFVQSVRATDIAGLTPDDALRAMAEERLRARFVPGAVMSGMGGRYVLLSPLEPARPYVVKPGGDPWDPLYRQHIFGLAQQWRVAVLSRRPRALPRAHARV
jgi:hypothetical protein